MIRKRIAAFDIAHELCDSLGLDPSFVRSIQLNVKHDDIVSVNVEMFVAEDGAKTACTILQRYDLIASGEPVKRPLEPERRVAMMEVE